MKNSIIAAASIFFLCISNLLCIAENSLDPTVEFYFINRITDEDLYVRFYPIGAIFNGEANLSNPTRYSILGTNVDPQDPNSGFQRKRGGDKIKHIIGLDGYALSHFHPETDSLYFKVEPSTNVSYDKWLLLGNDASANLTEMDGLFGYGNYMFEIYRTTNSGSSFELIMREFPLTA